MMSYNEYKAICAAKVAGPQKETSTSSNLTETPEDQNKVFTFIDETYRDIRRYYSGLRKDNISTQLLQTINKYKSGCNAVFNKALESNNACHKLSQNIVRTIDIFKELCECLTDLEEYNYRLCEIISIFVACELRLSVDAAPQEKLLTAHRIVYIMRRHLVQEEEQETLYNILRTLVFIPRLFDARDIMCAIFGIFIPIKPMAEVKILPDKLYMLYIIIFYRWMMMQENDDNKMSIVNFAESFMKPSVSLCSNKLYAAFLPMYNTHSTATRTILNNLKCYRDLRNATIINNALNKIGALVNLCDDEDDDIIVIETSPATDFQKIFASVHLEPLSGSMSNIKLEEKTVVGTVDLTAEEEPSNSPTSIRARHEKWLNEFHRLAKQHRESQLLLERQQNIQQISENRIEAVICLDSDSEDDEEITAAANASKKTTQATISKELYQTPAKTQQNNAEDLFVDSYPLTTTPINCEYDFESLDAEDENDVTKISPRFLTGTLRTYEGKKSNLLEKEDKRNSDDDDTHNRTQDSEKAYRRDSIHISFSPQERTQNDDDEGTDVQDEHDDMLEEEEETSAYTFLPTTSNKPEKEIFAKQIRPMGPYPTYNNMHNDKVLFSQSLSRYPQQQSHQQYHDKQYYYSDSSETKTPKKQKKRVHFNSSPLGPTVSMASQKTPLKSALQQSKYKASEAPDVFHLRGFERLSFASSIAGSTSTTASNSTSSSTKQQEPTNEIYNNLSNNNVKNHNHNNNSSDIKAKSTKKFKKDLKKQRPDNDISSCAPSIAGSNATTISTSSSIKQQEHLEAAVTLFRNIVDRPRQSFFYPAPFSPSSSSVSSRSLTSPAKPSTTRQKSRLPKNKIPILNLRRCTMGTRDDFMKNSELEHNNNEERYSIIRNREILNDGYQSAGFPSTASYNDDYYGVASDSDIVINSRYKNDAKLRKRCAVVIKPTKELRQYERKRDKMYNEILQEQRRKLELRALEKQREKERRLMDKTEEQSFQTMQNDLGATKANMDRATKTSKKSKNFNEIFMSSESEYETNFEVRTRKQRQQYVKDLQPLNIQIKMTEATTTSLLSQIDAHLEKPKTEKSTKFKEKEPQQEKWERAEKGAHINQQTCDISSDKGPKKPEEHNLLVDIAQHLSPYHLDLPEKNNLPRTPSPAPAPDANEKAIVTEHLIIQQEVAVNSYAHEPKLNEAANLKLSSPCATAMSPKISSDETLEQILEKSINVLKSVTSPLNNLKESSSTATETQNESTFPLLISNVESLNNIERHEDIPQHKSEDKLPLFSATDILYKDKNESKTKHVRCEERSEHIDSNKPVVILSSTILNPIENSLICAADVANISNESAITQARKVSSLMTAELSDISIESEISKHLPEIAEPSPVVTDMSDNSNDSGVSQNFSLHNSIISNSTDSNEISLPVLNLVMPSIQQPQTLPATTHQESIETSLINFNTSLYTPTKLAVLTSEEQTANNCSNDLNTPLKFSMQPELENEALKITLEPEADNNVTKFLDLILNKTVTDAESETRDKIIKELNALTTEATNLEPEACETEVLPTDSVENQKGVEKSNKTAKEIVENKSVESDRFREAEHQSLKDDRLREESIILKEPEYSQTTLDYSPEGHRENNDSALENVETENTVKHLDVLQTASSNNELNPPKGNPKQENHTKLLSNLETSESAVPILSPVNRTTKSALKQTFNIKCRVRLKRLNIDEHSKTIKNETWIAIPISKSEEPVNLSNELIKYDTVIETKAIVKKPCLKTSTKRSNEVLNPSEQSQDNGETPTKKAKIENETATATSIERVETLTTQPSNTFTPPSSTASIFTSTTAPISAKSKSKTLKTVTFDLSNLSDELRDTSTTMACNPKQKSKSYAAGMALGCYLKNSRPPRKLPDNTLRAAETLQLFVNTINDSTRTPPPAEFNKKRSPIKNKCIAEDETPRPPPTSTLMGTPTCKKSCTEKSRSQITGSKSKDQLVSSLATPSISSITSDITTARIYTSSPLDQTLPEYDDNVDTVADSELILPTTTGSLRRKLKRPKKSLTRPEPPDDIGTDDISNQPECNGEDDTDAVVDNEDDVFSEELLPIPTANEHILEDIVSARPSHIGPGTVIRDEYMNIEATATVPVYLFNDESRDLATPEPIQSSDTSNVVDSSSYLNTSCTISNNVEAATAANTTSALGSLEKSMLSPSEHEVSSTQETFYQTPTKNKQTETFGEKTSTNKDKVNGTSSSTTSSSNGQKQKPEDKSFKNKDYHTSSTTGLLQNNQVDTTNHSPEMCNLALTVTPMSTSPTASGNRKLRKATTHDEILFNEMQQLPSNKRKSTNTTTICAESTSDNSSKPNIVTKNLEDAKTNGSLAKIDDKFKKLLKGVCKNDKIQNSNELEVGAFIAGNNSGGGGGGSSPSTTTIINEETLSRSKRKKLKSSKASKTKNYIERSTKIVLKASKLTPHTPANPLIITIPKSRILRPPSTPTPPSTFEESQDEQSEFLDIPNAKLFIEKEKEPQKLNQPTKTEISKAAVSVSGKTKRSLSPLNLKTEINNLKTSTHSGSENQDVTRNTNSTTSNKEKSSTTFTITTTKKKDKPKTTNFSSSSSSSYTTCANSNNDNSLVFVKDKYDLIKSKDKHHLHNHNQHNDRQEFKEKPRDKTNSHTKSSTSSSNIRVHKRSTKEKVKGEKLKEKHKTKDKSYAHSQMANVLKLNTSQISNKHSLTALSTASAPSSYAGNYKTSICKSSKNNSSSSSSSSSSILLTSSSSATDILKSKMNLLTTQSSSSATATAVPANASAQINTATLSTNNVRKKLKIK